MASTDTPLTGPDFAQGIDAASLAPGAKLLGHANGEAVLLARLGDDFVAVGAACTHYSAPLIDGVIDGETLRCPWHHACFDLRTGEALRAPALSPVTCWRVEQCDGSIYVRAKRETVSRPQSPVAPNMPRSIVIVGGGAAGNAAAEMLRREG